MTTTEKRIKELGFATFEEFEEAVNERYAKLRYDPQRRCMTRCQADDDGYCEWEEIDKVMEDK